MLIHPVIGQSDFCCLLREPEHEDTLFLFNDTVVDHTSSQGGQLRAYNQYDRVHKYYPRTAGIVIGWNEWQNFQHLTDRAGVLPGRTAQDHILDSLDEIQTLIDTHHYKRILFAARPGDNPGDRPKLAVQGLIGFEVLDFVTTELYNLSS